MRNPGFPGDGERVHVSLVIDRPGVLRRAGSRSQARDQRVEALAAKAVAGERGRVGDVAETHARALEQLCAVLGRERAPDPCPGPHETHDVVTALDERARRRATDGAGRAQDEHAFRLGGPSRRRCRDINHGIV